MRDNLLNSFPQRPASFDPEILLVGTLASPYTQMWEVTDLHRDSLEYLL
jgi:hypothetical protein